MIVSCLQIIMLQKNWLGFFHYTQIETMGKPEVSLVILGPYGICRQQSI
jgi:hypothetical protein